MLRGFKADEELRPIPVVALTSSAAESDVVGAADYYVNSYLVNPGEFHRYLRMMADNSDYWLVWNQHP